jgi:hypothetical protein
MKPGDLRQFYEGEDARHSGRVFLVLEIYESANGVKDVDFLIDGVIVNWLFSYVESHSRLLGPV